MTHMVKTTFKVPPSTGTDCTTVTVKVPKQTLLEIQRNRMAIKQAMSMADEMHELRDRIDGYKSMHAGIIAASDLLEAKQTILADLLEKADAKHLTDNERNFVEMAQRPVPRL